MDKSRAKKGGFLLDLGEVKAFFGDGIDVGAYGLAIGVVVQR